MTSFNAGAFVFGVFLGAAVGLCIAGILSANSKAEYDEECMHECNRLSKRIDEAIRYAVVIRDAAGYRHIAVSKHLDEIIRILNGDEVKE